VTCPEPETLIQLNSNLLTPGTTPPPTHFESLFTGLALQQDIRVTIWSTHKFIIVKPSHYRPERDPEFLKNRNRKVVNVSALRTGRLDHP